uniref:Enolase N-terminal domain-containing protein n=1 Tax=Castor canadensis TaxID=51338 RepID=A0A8C0XAZ1_CASCN
MSILKIHARGAFDSHGDPVVKVDFYTKKVSSELRVPSGASAGTCEALELWDSDKICYLGKGLLKSSRHRTVPTRSILYQVSTRLRSGKMQCVSV